MSYLDLESLSAIDPSAYQARAPYPFVNLPGLLRPEAYAQLTENLPPLELFEVSEGIRRAHGQQPHDRRVLEYRDDLPVHPAWKQFVGELRAEAYGAVLCRLIGVPRVDLRFHWHFATAGNSVSPHCDRKRKLGSHIFYLNREADWDPAWGGETVVLDDGGRFPRNSAPAFDEFARAIPAHAIGNTSLLFTRRGNSWHGVRPLECPEGAYRKIFTVVIDRPRLAFLPLGPLRPLANSASHAFATWFRRRQVPRTAATSGDGRPVDVIHS